MPARDAATGGEVAPVPLVGALEPPGLAAEVQPAALGDGSDGRPFSTATYRGKRKPRT